MCNIGACRVAVESQDFYLSSPSPRWKGRRVGGKMPENLIKNDGVSL